MSQPNPMPTTLQMLTELADAVALFIDLDCAKLGTDDAGEPSMRYEEHALYDDLLKAREVIRRSRG